MKYQDRDQFLDPDDVTTISDENKQYLMDRGYRPYLTKRGKIKWIMPSQKGYRVLHGTGIELSRPPSLKRFVKRNIGVILVVGLVIAVLAIVLITTYFFL